LGDDQDTERVGNAKRGAKAGDAASDDEDIGEVMRELPGVETHQVSALEGERDFHGSCRGSGALDSVGVDDQTAWPPREPGAPGPLSGGGGRGATRGRAQAVRAQGAAEARAGFTVLPLGAGAGPRRASGNGDLRQLVLVLLPFVAPFRRRLHPQTL